MSTAEHGRGHDWQAYLDDFHAARPGITEDLLALTRDASGAGPYAWLAGAVPVGARVLDLACGSAPTGPLAGARSYLGLDLSLDELRRGAARGLRVARADATRLPVADAAVDVVVCSMALQLLPMAPALAEVRRVLRPGGVFAATVPASRPMTTLHALRWARVLLALHASGLRFPNDQALEAPGPLLAAHGLRLVSDESRAFELHVDSPDTAARLIDGLYLPGVPARRVAAAHDVVRAWVGRQTTIPVRRLVAQG